MATLTNFLTAIEPGHIRPFDVRRDLAQVADLVEKCFSDTLDPDGERYLQQMRAAARNASFLRWAAAAPEWASVPLNGYVWVQDQRLIGNISLIPFNLQGKRNYLIANVAVHPDYRQRGIARNLTLQAIEHARQRGAQSTWLHVRENNDPAIHLYQSLGYVERARRTTWFSRGGMALNSLPAGFQTVPRRSLDWPQQYTWLRQAYPPEITWHLPINLNAMRPGMIGGLYRLLTNVYLKQWSILRGGLLLGVVIWQSTRAYADTLWLAIPEEAQDDAVYALLLYVRQNLSARRPLSLDFPARQAPQAIQEAGFYAHQTLIWMQKMLSPKEPQ